MWSSVVVTLYAFASVVAGKPTRSQAPTATLSAGRIIGTSISLPDHRSAVNQFLGIPYAKPPLGDLRFAPPVRPETNHGYVDFEAISWPNTCIQQSNNTSTYTPQSEDCLYLNVFTPSTPSPSGDRRAVMFWIHGGSLKTGSTADPTYDGSIVAGTQDVVVVTTNYRLGMLGFSGAPGLALTDRNAGFYDQRMALSWVQENIAAFGGDPDKVTLWGESSGSTSVSRLVSTMHENPPFRAAILESGWYDYASIMDYAGDVTGVNAWNAMVDQLNCTGSLNNTAAAELACMREVDIVDIQTLLSGEDVNYTFEGTNDNVTQLEYPELARRQGRIARVPILTGTNANEGTIFEDRTTTNLTSFVESFPTLSTIVPELAAAYPVGPDGGGGRYTSQYYADSAIDTDIEFTCPTSRVAGLTAAALGLPVWRYVFNETFPNTEIPGDYVYHGSELELVFGTFNASTATADEFALSASMQKAWADFAKDPHGKGPGWPKINSGMHRPVEEGYHMVVLGGPESPSGWTVVSNKTIDKNCWIYQDIYANAAGGISWW